MDTNIILIETSTELCSTALAHNGKLISYKESSVPRAHASLTAVYVKEMLDECGMTPDDCSAVCVSMGPGSYTGLRVGVSTAKGLCFGTGKPLLAVGTLDTLVWQARTEGLVPDGCRYIVPMIDARRMEVYTAIFTGDCRQTAETKPLILDENSWNLRIPAVFLCHGLVVYNGRQMEESVLQRQVSDLRFLVEKAMFWRFLGSICQKIFLFFV